MIMEHTFLRGKFLDFIKNVVFDEIYILIKIWVRPMDMYF